MDRPTAIWQYDYDEVSPAYVNKTDYLSTDASFTFIDNASDAWFIGFDRRWEGFFADLSTNGSYTGMSFYYYAGGTLGWQKLQLIDSYSFSESKYLRWNIPSNWCKFNFTETDPYSATPPDTLERYWIKVVVSAVTTAAVISKIRVFPFACYATATEVNEFLQFKNPFNESSRPSENTVEGIIRRIEARIDFKTKKSWRFNSTTENIDQTQVDYNRYGIYLRHRDFCKIYSVKIWDGGQWTTLVEGRNNDYHIQYNIGMIYFTRMWLLPAIFGMTGRYFQYGFGEYKNAVMVDYAYGRDKEQDKEYQIVKDITIALTGLYLLQHHDYSTMIVSGTDKVTLEAKVRLLSEEAEERLEELSGIAIF